MMKTNRNDLTTVVKVSSTLSLSLMASFLQSLQAVHPHLQFRFSAGTVWSFILTALGSWFLWQMFTAGEATNVSPAHSRKKIQKAFLALCGASLAWMIFQFAVSMKGLSSPTAHEITEGGLLALAVLSAMAFLFWKITRGFNDPND